MREIDVPELMDISATLWFFGNISRATLYRGIGEGTFPPPIKINRQASRWVRSECAAALVARVAARDGRAA